MVTKKIVGKGEKNLKFGISIYTLLYIKSEKIIYGT